MTFDVDRFSQITQRLEISDLDFSSFRTQPLSEPVLRCLRYMHDVEHHTVCYMRDLLVTRAHNDSDVTKFLTIWNYEEHWHGDAIGRVLAMHDEPSNAERVNNTRHALGIKNQISPLLSQVGSLISRHVIAVYMTWGAINEWTTQAAYARLAQKAEHPVLSELLKRIMKQEGRHIDFYMSQATTRLEASRFAQKFVRRAVKSYWAPVGSSLMSKDDVNFLITFLFDSEDGITAAERIDRRVATLPGLDGLTLVRDVVADYAKAS